MTREVQETMAFKMDPKYFQRGQTWQECLTSWQHERANFLARVQEAPILPKFAAWLTQQPDGTRFALVYDPFLADSRKVLPALARTLDQAANVTVRCFDHSIYFPDLHGVIGRRVPCWLTLDQAGNLLHPWGPRPTEITREMAAADLCDAQQRLSWLLGYDQARFDELLDQDLTTFAQN